MRHRRTRRKRHEVLSYWLARLAWHDPLTRSLESQVRKNSGLLIASESSTYYSKILDEVTP